MRYTIFILIISIAIISNYVSVSKTIMDCERDWSYYPGGFKDKTLIYLMDRQPNDLLSAYHAVTRNITGFDTDNKYYERYLFTDFILNKNIYGNVISINNYITDFKNFRIDAKDERYIFFRGKKINVFKDNDEGFSDYDKGLAEYKLDIEVDKIDLKIVVNSYQKDILDPYNFATSYKCKIVESKI